MNKQQVHAYTTGKYQDVPIPLERESVEGVWTVIDVTDSSFTLENPCTPPLSSSET